MASYPIVYQDSAGIESTTLENDGHTLRIMIRGVTFSGPDFDSLSPEQYLSAEQLTSFQLNQGDLCACTLEWAITIPVVRDDTEYEGTLHATIVLGDRGPRGGLTHETATLRLRSPLGECRSRGFSGCFEDELLELQSQLPQGAYMKACITCAFSDYSPYGHGLFGSMACFRGNKLGYMSVRSKADLFQLWGTLTEMVQETHLCPEFLRRRQGAGYRG